MSIDPSDDPRMSGHVCTPQCKHSRVNVSSKSGPARMATTQERFRKELSRRFSALRSALKETLVENDALRLERLNSSQGPRDLVNEEDIVEAATDFEFSTGDREEAFMGWWEDAVDEGLVEPMDPEAIQQGQHYSATHVENGYEKGIKWADARANQFGVDVDDVEIAAVLERPAHQDSLQTLYSRTYGHLEGIGQVTEDQIREVLTRELADGTGSREMGRILADETRTIQRARGRRIARTEVMNAQIQATGTRWQEFDIQWANISTVEPCQKCIEFREAGPHRLQTVMDALPIHPNCVCAMVPADPPEEGGQSPDAPGEAVGPQGAQ